MSIFSNKNLIERYSRQIVLKKIGFEGQKKILSSKVFVVGAGGLGCTVIDQLARAGIGEIAVTDFDKVTLSNIHRQVLYNSQDLNKYKVDVLKKKIKKINSKIKLKIYKSKINKENIKKFLKNYQIIVDGSDNFETKFLLNKYCLKLRKRLIVGSINKFDGHVFSLNFKNNKSACLKCFYQEIPNSNLLNCETEGVVGTIANIVGSIQANEVLKIILNLKEKLYNSILIINILDLSFRISKFVKIKKCICGR